MLRPRVRIEFKPGGDDFQEIFSVKYFKSVECFQTYNNLTGIGSLIIPVKTELTEDGDSIFEGENPIFKRGNFIKIKCGYYPNEIEIFSGYIKTVNTNIPTTIEFEDRMFLLKRYTFNIPSKVPLITKSKRGKFLKRPKVDTTKLPNLTIKELFDIIIPDDIEYKILDNILISKLRVSNATPCMILEKLKETHGLFSYFVGEVLYIGFANNAQDTVEAELKFERQVINSNDLYYKLAEQVLIKVRATSINDNNVVETITVGPDDGEQRDYHYYNISKDELKKNAEKLLNELVYTGYYGTLETFLEPRLRHGDRVKLTSTKLPERNGTYLIKSVRTVISVDGGGRQFLELGAKIG